MPELHAVVFGDTELKRHGLARLLFASGLQVETAPVVEAGEKRAGEPQPKIALVCVEQGLDVGRIVQDLRARFEGSKIVVIAAHDLKAVVRHALRHGAAGVVTEAMSVPMLRRAMEIIAEGAMVLPNLGCCDLVEATNGGVEARRLSGNSDDTAFDHPTLSARELAILSALSGGDSNKLIARKLGIAEATVKVHVKAILRKIGLRNRTQAAIWSLTTSRRVVPPKPANGSAGEQHGLNPQETVLEAGLIDAVAFGVGGL